MVRSSRRFVLASSLVGLLGVWAAAPANASLVTVSGGLVGYQGPAGGACGGFQSYIGGVNVSPASDCDSATGYGTVGIGFPTTTDLVFRGTVGGKDLPINELAFVAASPRDVSAPGVEFLLGTLSFTNGSWFGQHYDGQQPIPDLDWPKVPAFHLRITTASSDPLLNGKTLDDWLVLDIRTGVTIQDNADGIYFRSFRLLDLSNPTNSSAEILVPEGGTGSVALYGKIGSLTPTAFADPQGSAFIGQVTAPQPVPEPATLTTLGLGIAALARRMRRARSQTV